jgi:hypothetical protein
VAAVSATDIWAVGDDNSVSGSGGGTIVEHWNGHAWSSVHSPSPVPDYSNLYAVAAVSAKEVWAVGNDGAPFVAGVASNDETKGQTPLIERWNGTKWQQVTSAIPKGINELSGLVGIEAVSADNIWAVGLYGGNSSTGVGVKTLIEHWNGKVWANESSPDAKGYVDSALEGVSGSSASNIWSVGVTYNGSNDGVLYEKWNGRTWAIYTAS